MSSSVLTIARASSSIRSPARSGLGRALHSLSLRISHAPCPATMFLLVMPRYADPARRTVPPPRLLARAIRTQRCQRRA
ncbi:hypothetical protein HYPSUDRAFT_48067 [Hypholoma sublateritium FD-334 SS-4]|uniref:Uncharacterized protein n=1 Tax=Hypholoma sublateritium (strain FD-334 SS-4) TaxID=945553 RepID=A0A0D2LY00_HYPSF|nr:hypothetical protein HYPSUDRAFT_48067 [Hypholoma sublateritium FD-334 SS-4]